jgi:nitroimidazol reductase NimA-like FMN-containing flavoprotein (pyridoxamine 5'-phosphate oxidase superfamily)
LSAPTSRYDELTRSECLERLAAGDLERVVVVFGAHHQPVIRPVNYAFDQPSQSVVFATGPGSKLYALSRATRAWFEIDAVDYERGTGWSVIIDGVTEPVLRAGDL